MAHVIDFTLFYGGVASAPAAGLPFAGSSFDVQEGVTRRAIFGAPEFDSVAIVEPGAVANTAPAIGSPALNYAALWGGAGGVSHTASIGAVNAATGVELADVGAGARTAALGNVSAAVGVELSGLTAGAKAAELGGLTVAAGVELSLAPVVRAAELGTANVLNAVTLDVGSAGESVAAFGTYAASTGVNLGGLTAGVRTAGLGKLDAYSTCAADMDTVPGREPAFGELAALQAVTVTLTGFTCRAAFGAYSLNTTAETSVVSIMRETELGSATVLNALTLDVAGIGASSGIGALAVHTGVELVDLNAGARETALGSVDAWTEVEVQANPVSVQDMAVGLPVAYSVCHVDAQGVSDTAPVVNSATAVSGLALDMGGYEHDEPVLGSLAVNCGALVETDGVGRVSVFGAPSISIEVFPGGMWNEVVFGQLVAYSARHVEVKSVPDSSVQIGGAVFYSAVTLDFASVVDVDAGIGDVAVHSSALAEPESVVLASAFGVPTIVIEVYPDGFASASVFGNPVAHGVRHVDAESVADVPALVGRAEFYSAVTLDFTSAADTPSEVGFPEVTYSALMEPDGFERTPSFGAPSIVIEVFPASVVREPAFGGVTTWNSALAEPASVADVPAQVGGAEFYSAVALGFASVADVPAEAGKPVVTTASFVELDGFGRTAVLGKPSITIEAFPASVVREPAVGAAAFISAKETAPASVPDAPTRVSGADFVSVALVRPAGLAAGSVEMGGDVTVETTALILPASVGLSAVFGQPDLAVIIRPDSLVHECSIGSAVLIPAHTADMTAFIQAVSFGSPDVGFGLLVEPDGVRPQGHAFGNPAYSWRKCPRWDLRAQLQREADLGAEIRPAPVAAQVWRGEGCVCRARAIEAMVMRWTDLHTIARPKNAMDAAVRRKEQI